MFKILTLIYIALHVIINCNFLIMLDVVNKYGGHFYFQIFYGTIVMLGLICLVTLLVLSHIINPGAKCRKGF